MARKSSESKQMEILHPKKGKLKSFHGEKKDNGWSLSMHHQSKKKSRSADDEPMGMSDHDDNTSDTIHSTHQDLLNHLGSAMSQPDEDEEEM
jgi:hypothetical protein